MRQLAWMARPRIEWLETLTRLLAASCGIDLDGASDVLPYNPAMLEGMANSGKD